MKKTNTKKSNSKDVKLPKIGNQNQKGKSPADKSNSKNKNLANSKSKKGMKVLKTSSNLQKTNPSVTKLEETNEKRKKRLEKERKEEQRDKKIYDQVLKEYKEEKTKARLNTEVNPRKRLYSPKNNKLDIDNIQLPKIKISEKRTQTILEEGGMLDAYKHLVIELCKNGLPTGNLFEYSAIVIRNYEKKWKEKKSKMNKEKFEKYWKEKKEEIENSKKKQVDNKKMNKKDVKEEENKIKALNRSLEQREINKLIKSMDRSRSSRNHQSFEPYSKNKNKKENNSVITVQQQEGAKDKNKKSANKSKSPTRSKSRKSTAKSAGKSPAAPQKKGQAKKKK